VGGRERSKRRVEDRLSCMKEINREITVAIDKGRE
jgi:hypothetical protein